MSDLSKVIDLDLLQLFGEETVVPMKGTISSLAQAVGGLNTEVESLSDIIAPTETSPAQTAHAAGESLIYAGVRYKVISAISIGDALIENTNIIALGNISNQLKPFTGATAQNNGDEGTVPQPLAGDEGKFLCANGSWANVPGSTSMTGATDQTAGTGGLTPTPGAGDGDKVLQGNGTWGKKLQIDIVVQNNVYGYIGANNTFIPFKSQADIDAAVSAAKVGNATAADVLSGKTFTNSTTSGVTGTMPSRSLGTAATGSGIDNTGPWVYMPYGYYPEYSGKAGNSYIYMTAAQAVNACPKQSKSCTPSTSAQTISPDSGKVLESVTVNAIQTQEKTVTAGTSAASVTPDSGKYLSKVTYNPTPSQTKTSTPTLRSSTAATVTPDSGKLLSKVTVDTTSVPNSNSGTYTASTKSDSLDMGATNTYRYVKTSGIPNSNSGTYSVTGHGTALDMGASNSYRYVNTTKAYNAGKTDYVPSSVTVLFNVCRNNSSKTNVETGALNCSGYKLIVTVMSICRYGPADYPLDDTDFAISSGSGTKIDGQSSINDASYSGSNYRQHECVAFWKNCGSSVKFKCSYRGWGLCYVIGIK